jgi:hypothetical protein
MTTCHRGKRTRPLVGGVAEDEQAGREATHPLVGAAC